MANLINKIKDSSFLGFALVGAINTGFSFIIYILLLRLDLYYILASILAYIAGIAVSYLLNTKFVFKEEKTIKNLSKFVSVYLTALVINTGLLYALVNLIGFNPVLGQIGVTCLVLFYNYVLQKLWTFKKASS
ncbi:GtrA family protein [Acetoanaerobium noterae]|uniref:GtrA family protein n=1 Tax=Acetoanaerobium noterae TaxID=745369 RepID=UPI0028AED2E9|nr:GtrA family protein [Acetoanaerobium noterae]